MDMNRFAYYHMIPCSDLNLANQRHLNTNVSYKKVYINVTPMVCCDLLLNTSTIFAVNKDS